jgi:hypothetical protein
MKRVVFSLLLAGLLAVSCFAEVLMTAPGQGTANWAWQIFSSSTPMWSVDSTTIIQGTKILRGINDDWDFLIKIGNVTTNPSDSNTGATENGVGLKYTIPKDILDAPFDIAWVLNNDSISGKDFNQTMTSIGWIGSKAIRSYLDIYGLYYSVQTSSKITGERSETSFDVMWGFGIKYHITDKFSQLMENLTYTMSGDTYHTFCFAVQYDLL